MPTIRLPFVHDTSYEPPRGNVLLLTCMDLRLLDDTVQFMDHDNLANRYDHVVFAGAALGALGAPGGKDKDGKKFEVPHWRTAFFDHLKAAIDLHEVEDIYILQHRNCGAFHKVFHVTKDFGTSDKEQRNEKFEHLQWARKLEKAIQKWAKPKKLKLRTHRFLMDLRGHVDKM